MLLHPWVGHRCDVELARRGDRRRLLLVGCALPLAVRRAVRRARRASPARRPPPGSRCASSPGNLLFAAYQVPYLATPADLRIGYHERTRLMAFRMVVLTLGILVSGLLAPLLAGGDTATRGGYLRMGGAAGGRDAGRHAGRGRRDRPAAPAGAGPAAAAPRHGGWRALAASLRDRQFRWLVGAYLAMSTTTHLVLAGVPYYAEYELGRPRLTTVLVAAFVAPALLVTPAGWWWPAGSASSGRCWPPRSPSRSARWCCAVGRPAGLPVLVAAVAVLGVAFAGMQLLPFSMVPDVIRAAGDATGAGTYTGVWTATEATGARPRPVRVRALPGRRRLRRLHAPGRRSAQSGAALAAIRLRLRTAAGRGRWSSRCCCNAATVMIDASGEPLEENIRITRQVVDAAHARGISVEAELGQLGGVEEHVQVDEKNAHLTDPAEAEIFVQGIGLRQPGRGHRHQPRGLQVQRRTRGCTSTWPPRSRSGCPASRWSCTARRRCRRRRWRASTRPAAPSREPRAWTRTSSPRPCRWA